MYFHIRGYFSSSTCVATGRPGRSGVKQKAHCLQSSREEAMVAHHLITFGRLIRRSKCWDKRYTVVKPNHLTDMNSAANEGSSYVIVCTVSSRAVLLYSPGFRAGLSRLLHCGENGPIESGREHISLVYRQRLTMSLVRQMLFLQSWQGTPCLCPLRAVCGRSSTCLMFNLRRKRTSIWIPFSIGTSQT